MAGRVQVEGPHGVIAEGDLAGRQGRLLLVRLLLARGPVTHQALADLFWGDDRPRSWSTTLSPLASRLRSALDSVGGNGRDVLVARPGMYELVLRERWVDVEVATRALDRAEGHIAKQNWEGAWTEAAVSSAIFRRPFLDDVDHPWVAGWRDTFGDGMVRSLTCLAEAWLAGGRWTQAEVAADEAIRLDPFREVNHRQRIRALIGAGNRARALQAYRQLEDRLAEEFGVNPSPETEALYEMALGVSPLE